MAAPPPSQEERQAIAQLIRSRGWFVVMRDFIIPTMQQATANLDKMSAVEAHANIFRGQKKAFTDLVTQLYKVAGLSDPFERYDKAMLKVLAEYSGMEEAEETQPLSHWIVNAMALCEIGGNEPIVGARSKDTITCPACREALALSNESDKPPRRASQPV